MHDGGGAGIFFGREAPRMPESVLIYGKDT